MVQYKIYIASITYGTLQKHVSRVLRYFTMEKIKAMSFAHIFCVAPYLYSLKSWKRRPPFVRNFCKAQEGHRSR